MSVMTVPDERTIDARAVRAEHLETVRVRAHWVYVIAIPLGGTVLMLALMSVLDAMG